MVLYDWKTIQTEIIDIHGEATIRLFCYARQWHKIYGTIVDDESGNSSHRVICSGIMILC